MQNRFVMLERNYFRDYAQFRFHPHVRGLNGSQPTRYAANAFACHRVPIRSSLLYRSMVPYKADDRSVRANKKSHQRLVLLGSAAVRWITNYSLRDTIFSRCYAFAGTSGIELNLSVFLCNLVTRASVNRSRSTWARARASSRFRVAGRYRFRRSM